MTSFTARRKPGKCPVELVGLLLGFSNSQANISSKGKTLMRLEKQSGEFKVHHTSVAVDAVGSDPSYTTNMRGKASRVPGEGTSAWTQVALAIGLAVLLSLGTLACSSGSRPEQPQASKDAAAQPGAPATPDKPAAQPATSGMRIFLRSSERRGKATWMK